MSTNDPEERTGNLVRQITQGLRWSVIGQVCVQISQLVLSLALLRILTPAHFGELAQVTIFINLVNILTEFGLGSAIVQSDEVHDDQLSSIFWLNSFIGVGFTALFALSSPLLAAFYDKPSLAPIAATLGLGFVVSSVNVVQYALLRRAMNFKRLALIDSMAIVVPGAVAVGLALAGAGVWALVAQYIARLLVPTVLLWLSSPWRPRRVFDLDAIRPMLNFGGWLLGFSVANYTITNIDDALIGRVHGDEALGVYTKAYAFMLMPLRQVSSVVSRVMYPALSRIQNDHERVRAFVLSGMRYIALGTFPLMALSWVNADALVLVFMGEQWVEVTPLLRVLCPLGMHISLGTTVGWMYLSQGRSDLMFRWEMGSGVVKVTGIVVGLFWGVQGVATGYVIAKFLLAYPLFYFSGRLIGLKPEAVARNISGVLACALSAGALAFAVRRLTGDSLGPFMNLLTSAGLGTLTYIAVCHVTRPRAYVELVGFARTSLRARREGRTISLTRIVTSTEEHVGSEEE